MCVERWAFLSEIAPQAWRDCTNIKERPFSRRTDSKFRADAPLQPLMKRCRWPRNSWTRRVAKSSSKSKLGPLGEPAHRSFISDYPIACSYRPMTGLSNRAPLGAIRAIVVDIERLDESSLALRAHGHSHGFFDCCLAGTHFVGSWGVQIGCHHVMAIPHCAMAHFGSCSATEVKIRRASS